MKPIVIQVFFVALLFFFPTALAADPAKEKKPEEFGERSDSTISVQLLGRGVKRPGIYHLPPKTELGDAVRQAKLSPASIGFRVSRLADGVRREIRVPVNPKIPQFILLDGDLVHCDEEAF